MLDPDRIAAGERVVGGDREYPLLARHDGSDHHLRVGDRQAHRQEIELVTAQPLGLIAPESALGDSDLAGWVAGLEGRDDLGEVRAAGGEIRYSEPQRSGHAGGHLADVEIGMLHLLVDGDRPVLELLPERRERDLATGALEK